MELPVATKSATVGLLPEQKFCVALPVGGGGWTPRKSSPLVIRSLAVAPAAIPLPPMVAVLGGVPLTAVVLPLPFWTSLYAPTANWLAVFTVMLLPVAIVIEPAPVTVNGTLTPSTEVNVIPLVPNTRPLPDAVFTVAAEPE